MATKLAGCLACALAVFASASASAQVEAVDDSTQLRDGFVVGDNTIIHTTAGFEFGYISNVFFEEDEENGAGIFRVIVGFDIGSMTGEDGQASGDITYNFNAKLTYNEFISESDFVRGQRDLGVSAGLSANFYNGRTWSGRLENQYTRSIRPTNFEASDNLRRSVNRARATLNFQPVGRTLQGQFFYQNTIDAFETSDTSFANRLQHLFGLRANWQYLPVTRFYAQVTQGIFGALGSSEVGGQPYIIDALPLSARAGIDSAITELVTANVYFGWNVGFYSERATFNSPIYGAGVGWRYSPLGRLSFRFDREFRDSINSNFYSDYAFILGLDQALLDSLNASLGAQFRLRDYQGISPAISPDAPTRSDSIISLNSGLNYRFRDIFRAGASYTFSVVDTDFRYPISNTMVDDPGFTRHEVVGQLSVEY